MNVYVVILIQTFLGGATHMVAKSVTNDVDAVTLTFLRSLAAVVGFSALLWWRGIRLRVERGDRLFLGMLGLFGTGNQLIYMYGVHFTTAANGALLYALTPVLVLILSRMFLGEAITPRKLIGVLLAFGGISIVIFERGISLDSDYTFGNLVVFGAVTVWSMFTVFGKRMVLRYGSLQTVSLSAFLGATMLFPFGAASASSFNFSTLSTPDWLGILYLGLGTSVLSYLMWYYALGRIEAGRLAVFSNGQPIVAALLSAIFLQYTVTASFVIGGTLTVTGVVLAQRS